MILGGKALMAYRTGACQRQAVGKALGQGKGGVVLVSRASLSNPGMEMKRLVKMCGPVWTCWSCRP